MSYLGKTGAVPKKGLKNKQVEVDKRGKGLKEAQIQKQCESLLDTMRLAYIRIPDKLYSTIYSPYSKIPPQTKAFISTFIKGIPDITILLRDGRFICCELKTTTGKLSQGQKNFCKLVGEDNYHIVRSVEGLQELLKRYGV